MVVHFTKWLDAAATNDDFSLGMCEPCPAKAMGPMQRSDMATRVLGGASSASQAARDNNVSRKFVGAQTAKAQQALDDAFAPPPEVPEDFLFWLPVTKSWIKQATLGLALTCRGSERAIVQFFSDHLDFATSVGTVHNTLASAVPMARVQNDAVNIANIRDAALDELFQATWPILAGIDVPSNYCFLLSREEHRDADTWGVRLLELLDRGFKPSSIIADFGGGLRAGIAEALPDATCRGDVFHAVYELNNVLHILENRGYRAIERRGTLQHKQAKQFRRSGRKDPCLSKQIIQAQRDEEEALVLIDDVKLLVNWLRHDVLAVAGPCYADRQELYHFVLAELCPRLDRAGDSGKQCATLLRNHCDDLLAFALQLERDLATLAQQFEVDLTLVHELSQHLADNPYRPRYWQQEARFQQRCRGRLHQLKDAIQELHRHAVRASSAVENLNGRLRGYFSLRRHLGSDYLDLLRFYLNHRPFPRSARPERTGKSPRELLTGQQHPHWLELLGYQRFMRN